MQWFWYLLYLQVIIVLRTFFKKIPGPLHSLVVVNGASTSFVLDKLKIKLDSTTDKKPTEDDECVRHNNFFFFLQNQHLNQKQII